MRAIKHSQADDLINKFLTAVGKYSSATAISIYGIISQQKEAEKWTLDKVVNYWINQMRDLPGIIKSHTANATYGDLSTEDSAETETTSSAVYTPSSTPRTSRSKGCMHLTGKPEAENCSTLVACPVTNPKHRPAAKDRSPTFKKYLNNYFVKLKSDSNLLSAMRKKFKEDKERDEYLDRVNKKNEGTSSSSLTSASTSKPVIDTGNFSHDAHYAQHVIPTVLRTEHTQPFDTSDMWAYDSCANVHVVNHHLKASFEPEYTVLGASIRAGSTVFQVVAYGTCTLDIGPVILTLRDVAYAPGFHTNIISHCLLEKSGIWWHGYENALYRRDKATGKDNFLAKLIKPNNDMPYVDAVTPAARNEPPALLFDRLPVRQGTNQPICSSSSHSTEPSAASTKNSQLSLFSHQSEAPTDLRAPAAKSSHVRQPRRLTMRQWHMMLGHAGKERLREFYKHVLGVEVVGDVEKELENLRIEDCEVCGVSKSTRIYSRIERIQDNTPFGHLCMDTCYFPPAYDGSRYMIHLTDLATSLEFAQATIFKKGETLTNFLLEVVRVANSMDRVVTRFSTDMDSGLINPQGVVTKFFETAMRNKGIRWTPATKEGHHQLPAEIHGKRILDMMRCLQTQCNLGIELWSEYMHAAVYILNRLPAPGKRGNKTPIELATKRKPDLSNLRMYGCKAFVHKVGVDAPGNSEKTEPRAHIGYLCGFIGNAIYRVWVPSQKRVLTTSYVRFNELQYYRPGDLDAATLEPGLLDEIDMPHIQQNEAIAAELRDLWMLGQRPTEPAQALIDQVPYNDDTTTVELPGASLNNRVTGNSEASEVQLDVVYQSNNAYSRPPADFTTVPAAHSFLEEREFPQYQEHREHDHFGRKRTFEDSEGPFDTEIATGEDQGLPAPSGGG